MLSAEIRLRHARRAALVLALLISASTGIVILSYKIRTLYCEHVGHCPQAVEFGAQPGLSSSSRPPVSHDAFFEALPVTSSEQAVTTSGATIYFDKHLSVGRIVGPVRAVMGFVITSTAHLLHQTTVVVSSASELSGMLISAPGRTCHWTIVGDKRVELDPPAFTVVDFGVKSGKNGTFTIRVRSDGDPARSCAIGRPLLTPVAHAAEKGSSVDDSPSSRPPLPLVAPSIDPSVPPGQSNCANVGESLVALLVGDCKLLD
jgi:hypothetical protein